MATDEKSESAERAVSSAEAICCSFSFVKAKKDALLCESHRRGSFCSEEKKKSITRFFLRLCLHGKNAELFPPSPLRFSG